jgi:uncharacterized YigZ family protein
VLDYRYLVIGATAGAELRERGSRFVARLEPVVDEAEAKSRLAAVAGRHPDASHHCWAWRLGNPPRERSSDAGEPAGTAGAPILRRLRAAGVSDVLAVVTRWFGGTKLGKGGLARAYGGVAREALAAARFGERFVYETLEVTVPYAQVGDVRRLVHPPEVEIASSDYGESVRFTIRVVPPRRASVADALGALGLTILPVVATGVGPADL